MAEDLVTHTEVFPVNSSGGEVVDVVSEPEYPPLSPEEDMFALAVVDCGGNLALAYKAAFGPDVRSPGGKARALLSQPKIAARIKDLMNCVHEGAMISVGSHMVELAEIRDLAKVTGALKVALEAEKSRGVVAGFYVNKINAGGNVNKDTPVVMISINSSTNAHDANV